MGSTVTTTARDLIRNAMLEIGAVATGEAASADEASDGLVVLNRMLASWSTESLFIYSNAPETFPLVNGQQVYTMGPSGNFNTTRPLRIQRISLQLTANSQVTELPVEMVNLEQWANIVIKAVTSPIALRCWASNTYPLETLNFWPVPSAVNNIVIYSDKLITSFATINDVVSLPPGYEEAVHYSLAMRLAPQYGKQASAETIAFADKAIANIKRLNIKPHYLTVDAALMQKNKPFNWLIGE